MAKENYISRKTDFRNRRGHEPRPAILDPELRTPDGRFKKGCPPPPEIVRRKRSVGHKMSRDLKNSILNGAINCGSDGKGTGGLEGFLTDLATNHKQHFTPLLGKMLPLTLKTDLLENGAVRSISILSMPTERFLTEQDIKMLQLPKLEFVREDDGGIIDGSLAENSSMMDERAGTETVSEPASTAPENVAVLKPR